MSFPLHHGHDTQSREWSLRYSNVTQNRGARFTSRSPAGETFDLPIRWVWSKRPRTVVLPTSDLKESHVSICPYVCGDFVAEFGKKSQIMVMTIARRFRFWTAPHCTRCSLGGVNKITQVLLDHLANRALHEFASCRTGGLVLEAGDGRLKDNRQLA